MAEAPKPVRAPLDAEGARKAAILMVSVDQESAARVMSQLDKQDQERVAFEIIRLDSEPPSKDEQEGVLREFYNLQVAQQYVDQGGHEYARKVLEKLYSADEARKMMETIESSMRMSAFRFLRRTDTVHLVTFIADEHPQTIAIILAYLGPSQAAGILEGLPAKKQGDVIKRLATMEHTSPEAVEQVEKALEAKLASFGTQEFRKTGGVESTAEILNLVQRSTERSVLEALHEEHPELVEQIRRLMFTFDDILRSNDRGVQNLLRSIDTSQLSLALKHASPELREKFFKNMSPRAADLVKEEMEFMGPVRLSDVEAAQQAIVDVVRRLEDQGELIIEGRGGGEEIVP